MSDSLPPHPRDPTRGRRREFDALARQEGKALNDRAFAQMDGAMNLLTKAVMRLDAGEIDQADRLIARAAAMPYDAHDEGSPGIRGACQLVYNLVGDELEMSDEDDSDWLTIAIDVHGRVDDWGRRELESILNGFVLQGDLFSLSRPEQLLIRKKFGHAHSKRISATVPP